MCINLAGELHHCAHCGVFLTGKKTFFLFTLSRWLFFLRWLQSVLMIQLNNTWTRDSKLFFYALLCFFPRILCHSCIAHFLSCWVFLAVVQCSLLFLFMNASLWGISRDLSHFCLCQLRLGWLQAPVLQERGRSKDEPMRNTACRNAALHTVSAYIYRYIDINA